jgi:hypothetical protein
VESVCGKAQNQFLSVNKQLSGASISSENEIEISKMLTEAKKIFSQYFIYNIDASGFGNSKGLPMVCLCQPNEVLLQKSTLYL